MFHFIKAFFIRTTVSNEGLQNLSDGQLNRSHVCKLLVVGGGSGGCSVSAKFSRYLRQGELIILEPSDVHYYQPLFALVCNGVKKLSQSCKPMRDVLPKKAIWIQDAAAEFDPKNNTVTTAKGDTIKYDYMLVAVGLQANFDQIPGLVEALNKKDANVGSIYSPKYVEKMFQALLRFKSGNAIFTYPQSTINCPGAPQKACYISEDYLQSAGKRENANVMYNTTLPVLFGIKKYADALWKVVEQRNIKVNLRTHLVEIKPDENIAVFENLDKPGEKTSIEYSILHVAPPMSAPDVIRKCKDLVNDKGYVDVDKHTLQHTKFPNVFAIGDCSSTPNSKTAAAVAAQTPVVYSNLRAVMEGKKPTSAYDGYASCPLVTGTGKCILAEFDYSGQPLETLPISQDRELYIAYMMKKTFMPFVYWHLMLKGYWNGPGIIRKILHLDFFK